MKLKDYDLCKTLIQKSILDSRVEFKKEQYIEEIKSFFNNNISHINFQFSFIPQKINPVLTFVCFEEIPPRMMYKFCDEFDFYAPTVRFIDLVYGDVREYKFTKKIEWDKLEKVDVL